jgi:hypothetical protein
MSQTSHDPGERHVFRTDRFVMPTSARAEFLARVRETHELLRRQPGYVQDLVLERPGSSGALDIITMVEWQSEVVVAQTRAVVAAFHRESGFDPQEFRARLGITADIGTYTAII